MNDQSVKSRLESRKGCPKRLVVADLELGRAVVDVSALNLSLHYFRSPTGLVVFWGRGDGRGRDLMAT